MVTIIAAAVSCSGEGNSSHKLELTETCTVTYPFSFVPCTSFSSNLLGMLRAKSFCTVMMEEMAKHTLSLMTGRKVGSG